ncbi:trans-2-enoyl-CoA reductase [Schizosaccharomyces octosporus yFS286]|uniref:Trans-2-enoyl-CoA reductase n=1 Tax=Schizosaccharomyces octosporus (strain yFS286) TaxID=483514 RepID=S9PZA3_SCHOY|nr:trans-2-enoyl-CoA reductase [Schizosaccharomyces octosporus yFS286]EPX72788.1 trans-2-enoyl-CoA reductase [Schizosaccharomyces octosporus yFS286]
MYPMSLASERYGNTLTRKAWVYSSPGEPQNVLRLVNGFPGFRIEQLKPGDVIVDIEAVSINPVDYKLMRTYQLVHKAMQKPPVIPGFDFAGKVVSTGPSVTGLKAGDRVWGKQSLSLQKNRGGTLTNQICSNVKCLHIIPDSINFNDAAAFGTAGVTAWEGLVEHMKIKPGQKVVIVGASGGVGTFAIQIAKALGAEVTSISSTKNIQLCKSLGAFHTIDYKSEDVVAKLAETGPYDFVFDLINDNGLYRASSKFMKREGSFFGIASDISLSYIGSVMSRKMRPKIFGGSSNAYHDFLEQATPEAIKNFSNFVAKNKVETVIDSVYNFDHALDAFERVASHRSQGNVIVTVN